MRALIFGDGPMGRAVADALSRRGDDVVVLGPPTRRDPGPPPAGEVAFEFSVGSAAAENVSSAIGAGHRRFVIGTTGWDADRPALEDCLRQANAAAVAAPNFSIATAIFLRLVRTATEMAGPVLDFDPYIVEWHRASKIDRPSGTAAEIARRVIAAHPRKSTLAPGNRRPQPHELEVASLRAGGSPGMHVLGFDAAGESLELRVTARDRGAYAAGAIQAATWLLDKPRAHGFHDLDAILAATTSPPTIAHPPSEIRSS